jgi:hypothetical protein
MPQAPGRLEAAADLASEAAAPGSSRTGAQAMRSAARSLPAMSPRRRNWQAASLRRAGPARPSPQASNDRPSPLPALHERKAKGQLGALLSRVGSVSAQAVHQCSNTIGNGLFSPAGLNSFASATRIRVRSRPRRASGFRPMDDQSTVATGASSPSSALPRSPRRGLQESSVGRRASQG